MLDCGRNKHMSRQAAIYDPYLDTLGGGERYCLTVAEILSKNGYQVDIFWSGDPELLVKAKTRFGLELSSINFVPDIFGLVPQKIDLLEETINSSIESRNIPKNNFLKKIKLFVHKITVLQKYDLLFYLSDGSLPFLFSRKNWLHIQVPFITQISVKNKLLNFIKSKFIHQVICNSAFTSRFITDFSPSKIKILYPPVDVNSFSSSEKKENIILSVGRFDNILNAKKQDVLIEAFQRLCTNNPNLNWKLVLMGGSREKPENNHYLSHLKYLAGNSPIEFIVNPTFDSLKKVYSQSKIYWHAAGYGVDELFHPEETEHFGMSVVEAMASGAVPLVVAKGGLTEIVSDSKNGYTWQNLDELIAKTQLLLATPQNLKKLSIEAQNYSQVFSKEKFEAKLLDLIKK